MPLAQDVYLDLTTDDLLAQGKLAGNTNCSIHLISQYEKDSKQEARTKKDEIKRKKGTQRKRVKKKGGKKDRKKEMDREIERG